MWCLVWVCMHLFFVYVHVYLTPPSWHEFLFAPICLLLSPSAVSLLLCWQTPLLLHSSLPPAFYLSLQCQFPPLRLALCQALRHRRGGWWWGCRPYANELTLCKSARLLIKSQLQIQLADWTEREELLGSMWCRFGRKKNIESENKNHGCVVYEGRGFTKRWIGFKGTPFWE